MLQNWFGITTLLSRLIPEKFCIISEKFRKLYNFLFRDRLYPRLQNCFFPGTKFFNLYVNFEVIQLGYRRLRIDSINSVVTPWLTSSRFENVINRHIYLGALGRFAAGVTRESLPQKYCAEFVEHEENGWTSEREE